jgi:hypothetical protein
VPRRFLMPASAAAVARTAIAWAAAWARMILATALDAWPWIAALNATAARVAARIELATLVMAWSRRYHLLVALRRPLTRGEKLKLLRTLPALLAHCANPRWA